MQLYKREGNELRFACPACNADNKRSLAVHTTKGFTCYGTSKRTKGNDAVALVAHVRGVSQYEAGSLLEEHFFHSAPRADSTSELEGRRESQAPLDYLEHSHPVAEMLGLSAATLEALGGGYAPKGTMAARLLIPLRLEDGRLMGYLGIATKEEQSPLLSFPKNLEERCTSAKSEPAPSAEPTPEELRKLFRIVS